MNPVNPVYRGASWLAPNGTLAQELGGDQGLGMGSGSDHNNLRDEGLWSIFFGDGWLRADGQGKAEGKGYTSQMDAYRMHG